MLSSPILPSRADVRARKRELRARARAARDAQDPRERAQEDVAIERQVVGLRVWRDAPIILTYLSFGSEVETHGLTRAAWEAKKTIAVPRRGHEGLEWACIDTLDGLARDATGIEEPPATAMPLDVATLGSDALALVPGLLFDERHFRLGYGGGYYDRFLAAFSGHSVGLCRCSQLVDSLAAAGVLEDHDRSVDMVVYPQAPRTGAFER